MQKRKETRLIQSHFDSVRKVLAWLCLGSNLGIALSGFNPILVHLEKVFFSRGIASGIAYIKAARGNYLNYLSGNPERFPGVRLTSSGIPVFFGDWVIKEISSPGPQHFNVLRALNTILFSTRALKTQPVPDIESIEGPSKRGVAFLGISMWAGAFWRELGYHHSSVVPRALRFRRFHFTTKTGPLGHALSTWIHILFLLPEKLKESICVLGGEKIRSFFDAAIGSQYTWGLNILPPKEDSSARDQGDFICPLRKLTYFPDKEGKTRVIAILDYFSQTVLRGLHLYLFKVLRKIPQDMTFDQGAFIDRIKSWKVFYSVDLSSATDRFPIEIESQVLKAHLPHSYVDAWKDVMVGYPFRYNAPGSRILTSHRYSVGNPMGAYSSWASFALAHHYIFFFISKTLGRPYKDLPYVLLGDDILIGDEEVGELYLRIISDLGVSVSKAKTHISKDLCEFAKRWIYKGREISPFPISALRQCGKKYWLLTALLMTEEKKGWVWSGGIDYMVELYFGMFKFLPARVKRAMGNKAYICEQIMRIIWGASPAEAALAVTQRLKIPLEPLPSYGVVNLLREVAKELFTASQPGATQVAKGKPLGLIAEHLVMYLTGLLETDPTVFTLLDNPVLQAYGNIEQQYLDLLKASRSIVDTGADWPTLLRAMTIPLSDAIFIDRREQTEALGAARIGNLFVAKLKALSRAQRSDREFFRLTGVTHLGVGNLRENLKKSIAAYRRGSQNPGA